MQLNIEINLDNATYENVGEELGNNLQAIIDRIGIGAMSGTVHDTNGNKTGYWIIKDEEREQRRQEIATLNLWNT